MLRRTPWRRRSELTNRTRLKQRSTTTTAKELKAWRDQEANAVHARVRCEVGRCREGGTGGAHHPFGRHDEPWGSSRLVQVLTCRGHHDRVTGTVGGGVDLQLRDDLRRLALERVRGYVSSERAKAGTRHTLVWMDDESESLPRRFAYVLEVARLSGIEPPHYGSQRRTTA